MPACGRPSASTRRAASSMTATAALLSAPRIVPAALRTTPSSTAGSIGPVGRNRVEVGAQEERDAAVRALRLQAAEQVADRRAHDGAGVVLVDLEREVAQVARDGVRDGPLLAGRARQRGQLGKQVESGLIHFTNLLEIGTVSMKFCRRRVRERRRTVGASRPTRGGYRPGARRCPRRRREHALPRRQPGRVPAARLHAGGAARPARRPTSPTYPEASDDYDEMMARRGKTGTRRAAAEGRRADRGRVPLARDEARRHDGVRGHHLARAEGST